MTGAEDEDVLNEMVRLCVTIQRNPFARSMMEKYKNKARNQKA